MGTTPIQSHPSALPEFAVGESFGTSDPRMGAADFLEIRDYLRIIYGRRWIIVAIIAAGLVGGVLYNRMATNVFEARATLQIEADMNVLALDRPLVEHDETKEFLPTQLGILASRDLARMAHEQLKLSASDGLPHERAAQVPTVDEIVRGRRLEPVKDARLVNIAFRSSDPAMAARVANALAQAYVQRNLEFRSRATGEASDWLSQQVSEQRKVVEASEAALQRYRMQHGADSLFTDRSGVEQQNIVVQKLGQLQAAVSKARADTIEKETQYRQLSAIEAAREPLDTLPAIGSNTFIQGLKGELAGLQGQLAQAAKELGERHPDRIKLQGAVQNAEAKLRTEISNLAQAIRNDFEAAQARERASVAALDRQRVEAQALNGKAIEYVALEREAASNREALGKLSQRAREASLARELQSTNVGIVDAAEVPQTPILPRRERNIMVSFVGSGVLAFGLVFMLELFNTRIVSSHDVERQIHVRVVGVMPQVKPQRGQVSVLLGDGAPPQFAELLHNLRTNLTMAPELASARALVVTSSGPGEGKTTVAANLAVSLARLNQRVLLIDADLRKPRLHELFGADQQPGLTNTLTGTATMNAFRKTKVPRLWLLPSGNASRNPADLLGSERFGQLIDLFRTQFDWVVLDSPPVLAVTDPCLIARVASGVLFVVGCGQTSRESGSAAVARLRAAGGTVVGALLNRAVLDKSGPAYLSYYHRDYQAYYPQRDGSSALLDVPDALSRGNSTGAAAPLV
jgi:succinoglycan biosynthesis transport protein ExoP